MSERLVFRIRSLGLDSGYTIECPQLQLTADGELPIRRFYQAVVECVRRSAGRDGSIEVFNGAGDLIEELQIGDAIRAIH